MHACNNRDGMVANLFGIPIQAETLEQVLDRVEQSVHARTKLHIGVVNAAKIVNMRHDPDLGQAVHESDVIYADGMSDVWASRILGCPLPERVAGIDLITECIAWGPNRT